MRRYVSGEDDHVSAIETLMNEHRNIERVLNCLEKAVERLDAGEALSAGFFLKAADFMQGFADGCHHNKEEGILFPALSDNGMSNEEGPLAMMLEEHTEARGLTRSLRANAERMQAGDSAAVPHAVQNARAYVALLRGHIAKEDDMLFPMASQILSAEGRSRVEVEFEGALYDEVRGKVHEKYRALIAELEDMLKV